MALLLAGCRGEVPGPPLEEQPPDDEPIRDGPWVRPGPETTWQWQLQGPVDTGHDVDLYDVDLFDTDEALLQRLKAEGRIVICYFSAGTFEDWRPDVGLLGEDTKGHPLEEWEGERWLDIRQAAVVELVRGRLALAAARGCDGVEPDNVDGYLNDTGFPLTEREQLAFNRFLANEAHRRGLAVGLKNTGALAAELVDYFDFSLDEQCHEYDECEALRPFLDAGKPVLNVEYAESESAAQALARSVCPEAQAEGLRTLILPLELDGSFRVSCD